MPEPNIRCCCERFELNQTLNQMYEFMHICSLYVYKFFVYKYLYTRILLCDVCEFLQDDEDLYMQCNCDNDDDDSTGVNSEYIVRCAVGAECVDSLFNYT